jgi:outer membrane lipoprotein SlyB
LQQAFQVASGANTNALQLQQNQNQFDQALKQSKRNSVQSLLAGLLPVAGALVGTAIGGPFGAAIGGITGEAAAKATSPKKTQAQPF